MHVMGQGKAQNFAVITTLQHWGKWGTQTFIAGLTQDALMAPWVITGAMNGPAFDT